MSDAASGIGAIVLAGGRSSRFGRDKLAEPIDGRPLLDHVLTAVRALTDDIVVVAAPGATPSVPADVRVVHDERPFEGPLVGLVTGLATTTADRVIVVAGDMPTLVPAVLGRLVARLGPDAPAAILGTSGRRAILPMALSTVPAAAAAQQLVTEGERRLGAILDLLGSGLVPEADWRFDDPDGRTLRDVDLPTDL